MQLLYYLSGLTSLFKVSIRFESYWFYVLFGMKKSVGCRLRNDSVLLYILESHLFHLKSPHVVAYLAFSV